jgi:hypothetical protein
MALWLELAGYKKWQSYKERTTLSASRHNMEHSVRVVRISGLIFRWRLIMSVIKSDASPRLLLLGLWFLWVYPTENQLCTMFDMSRKKVRKWSGVFSRKLQLLLPKKVSTMSPSGNA